MLPHCLPELLARIRALAAADRVRFTYKAMRELEALNLGLDDQDACDILTQLDAHDFVERVLSQLTDEWMYVFKPVVVDVVVYVKVIIRDGCVVISFHEDEG